MTSTEKAKAGLPLGGLEWGLRGLAWASDAAQAGGGAPSWPQALAQHQHEPKAGRSKR